MIDQGELEKEQGPLGNFGEIRLQRSWGGRNHEHLVHTGKERRRLISNVETEIFLQLERENRIALFSGLCRKAVVGAAMLLGRDPVALAEELSDGRLAWYIKEGEGPIRLELDPPNPCEPAELALAAASRWVRAEAERVEAQLKRVHSDLEELASDLERRTRHARRWPYDWRTILERQCQLIAANETVVEATPPPEQ
jgi:hypothetical protein